MGGGEREVRVHLLLENIRKFFNFQWYFTDCHAFQLWEGGTSHIAIHSNCDAVGRQG